MQNSKATPNSREASHPIDFSPLEGVGITVKRLKYYERGFVALLIAFSTISLWAGMYRLYIGQSILGLLIIAVFLIIAIGAALLYNSKIVQPGRRINRDGLGEFIQINGFEMHPGRKTVPSKKGSMFAIAKYTTGATVANLRKESTVENEISGTIEGFPFLFYDYTIVEPTGATIATKVMEIKLPHKQPHFMIDSLTSYSKQRSLPVAFNSSQKIELEGDFNNYFDLYAPEKDSLAALTLIAPDAMEVLMNHAIKCDIEIIEDRIFFYWTGLDISLKNYFEAFSTAEEVLGVFSKYFISGRLYSQTEAAEGKETANISLKKQPWLLFWAHSRFLGRLPSLRGFGIMFLGFILGAISLVIFDEDNTWGAFVYIFLQYGSIVLGFYYNLNRSFARKWRREYKRRNKDIF